MHRSENQAEISLMTRFLRGYAGPHWRWLSLVAGLMVIEGSTLGTLSYLLKPMFDRVLLSGQSQAIWWVGGAILGVFALRALVGVLQRVLMARLSHKIAVDIQSDLLAHLMTLDLADIYRETPGALAERIQRDTEIVRSTGQLLFQGVARDSVALLGLALVVLSIDAGWALMATIAIPLLILPALLLQRYIRQTSLAVREASARRAMRLDEVLHGIETIKLNDIAAQQHARFRELAEQIQDGEGRTAGARAMLPGVIDIVTGLGFLAVLIFGAREIIAGDKSIGDFMAFFSAMALAFQPLRRLGNLAGAAQQMVASLSTLYRLFDLHSTILDPARPATSDPIPCRLELCKVSLTYVDRPVVTDVSFVAEVGRITALVGPSGAGKTTLFKAMTRLIDTASGHIEIGGADIKTLSLADLRAKISVVSQDAPIFDDTIENNILMGRADRSHLQRVLDEAEITPFLTDLPNGLATRAGPRGANLSGGQRQRIALARALLRDTPILLLDEPTSALDAAAERVVQSTLKHRVTGKTVLVIAHRRATIRMADHIVVLDRGRCVDQGSHDALLERGGLYRDLYQMQIEQERAHD